VKNVILVHDIENNSYWLGILNSALNRLPTEVADNLEILDEPLTSDWGFTKALFGRDYSYRGTDLNLESSVVLAKHVNLLFPNSTEEKVEGQTHTHSLISKTQKYETIAF
jgi:hypothetical protein